MEDENNQIQWEIGPLPWDQSEALEWLLALVAASDWRQLTEVPADVFRRGWFAIGFLYPGLHPDAALNNGTEVSEQTMEGEEIRTMEPRLLAPWFIESGWPVVLAPVAAEARKRYHSGELREEEFYCSEAILAGMCARNPALAREIRESRIPE